MDQAVHARHLLRRLKIGYASSLVLASDDDPDGPLVTVLVVAGGERAAAVLTERDLMGTVIS